MSALLDFLDFILCFRTDHVIKRLELLRKVTSII
jgi:hypothetical protein